MGLSSLLTVPRAGRAGALCARMLADAVDAVGQRPRLAGQDQRARQLSDPVRRPHQKLRGCPDARGARTRPAGLRRRPGAVEHGPGHLRRPVASAELFVYDYKATDVPDLEALRSVELANFAGRADFHTLGMAWHPETSTLRVINHAQAGSRIETFKLDVDALVATHVGTIQHPLLHAPNSLTHVGDDDMYVTNDYFVTARRSKLLSQLETWLVPPSGTVVHLKVRGDRVEAQVVARVPFANGVEMANSSTMAIASTTKAAVYLYTLTREPAHWRYHSQLRVPFLPDNLSLSGGKLLIAGHCHLSLFKFAETRRVCNDPAELTHAPPDLKTYCAQGTAVSYVSEWSEARGMRHVYADTHYPTSTTAVRDARRGVGVIVGLYARGLLVWREK